MPTIVVLVKHVPDSWSEHSLNPDHTLNRDDVTEVIDEINEYAVEQALKIREAHEGYRVVALSAGTERAEETLRKALAMGADDAVLLSDDALRGSDVLGTAWALSNAITSFAGDDLALIVTGNASSDGSTGALPGILAEYRQIPALTNLTSCALEGGVLTAVRDAPEGTYTLSAPLPALISVTEKADKPRFANFKGIMAAKKATIARLDVAAIGVEPTQVGLAHAATTVTSAAARPERTQGQILVDNGDAAARIVQFLAAEKFI